ncbi:MAG: toll/interleukin-1 receptor domain-containing protein [Chloroflexi bacterium]|nr:toll/interleukin-1 receptor domain-containing protein [Chloroflexota bacterium]
MQRFIGLFVTLLIAISILIVAFIVAENFLIQIVIGLAVLVIFVYLVISLVDQTESSPAKRPEIGVSDEVDVQKQVRRRSETSTAGQVEYDGLPSSELPVDMGHGTEEEQEPAPDFEPQESVDDLIDYYGRSRVDDFVTEEEKSDVPDWVLDATDTDDDQIQDWFPTTSAEDREEVEEKPAEEPEPIVDAGATGEHVLLEENAPTTADLEAGEDFERGKKKEAAKDGEDLAPEVDGTSGPSDWYADADDFDEVNLPPEPSVLGSTVSPPPPPQQPSVSLPTTTPSRSQTDAIPDPSMEGTSTEGQKVHFTAFYPKEMKPDDWQPLHAYVYKKFVEDKVLNDARQKLGEKMAAFRQTDSPAQQDIAEGAMIVATPRLDGFQFNPPMVAIGFYKDWHRLDFELRATDAPLYQSSNGQLVFTVESIIVAEIPLSIYVSDEAFSGDRQHVTQKIYDAVFASYSHRDTGIVERVERAVRALGLDYLRDVTSLKSGQHWSDELLQLIERADIFQLFWSPNAADSDYVRQEYEHALKLARDTNTFIRPVYWQLPMVDPPAALQHLHFAYQPDLAEE